MFVGDIAPVILLSITLMLSVCQGEPLSLAVAWVVVDVAGPIPS